jgi:acetylornithine deacetylase/succinyl-diaminopimelate desuccinylase-like protein
VGPRRPGPEESAGRPVGIGGGPAASRIPAPAHIYLAFGHDEEIGGHNGAKQIVEWLEKNGVELAAVLDEGGFVSTDMLPG